MNRTRNGAAVARPRFPEPLTIDSLERAIVTPSWKDELPSEVRARAGEISNHVLVHCLERQGSGTTPLELALASRELLVDFALTAPGALDDGAPAKVWAAAFVATVLAIQWSEIPVVQVGDVPFDRGLDDDLIDDDEDDDLTGPIDLGAPRQPRWDDLVRECAEELALAYKTLICEVTDRAAVLRSTEGIGPGDRRWLVPSYRTLTQSPGVVRAKVRLKHLPQCHSSEPPRDRPFNGAA
ncbi:MAG: hypothetical protein U0572_11610 [Phycisphaerales bacterium]